MRLRFAPSPTGYLHVGGARTVLFNWLLARKNGGTLILRIEDTDRARHVEDSVKKILADLRWLGLTWDEGPEVGGAYGPYFQSECLPHYYAAVQRLLECGDAYYALETPEELAAMRERMKDQPGGFKYPRPDPLPTIEQGLAARAGGRPVVVRFRMPGTDIRVNDDILGRVVLPAAELEDFVIQKSDGWPTYHFACVVDDERMRITHVLRGQEHLMNTPKHIALQKALGFNTPFYAHLPVIFNMSGSKMSKRDKERAIKRGEPPPEIDVHDFRAAGYLPEAVLNFIALLGWNPGDDRERFTLSELTEAFTIERIGKTNARFDREKLLSFNMDWCGRVGEARLLAALKDYLTVNARPAVNAGSEPDAAGAGPPPATASATLAARALTFGDDTLRRLLAICAGFKTFAQWLGKVAFLFMDDDAIEFDEKSVRKVLAASNGAGYDALAGVADRLSVIDPWTVASIQAAIESHMSASGLKLGDVAQPLRVAITGATVSPPIFDSLELLGKEATLNRIRRCQQTRKPV